MALPTVAGPVAWGGGSDVPFSWPRLPQKSIAWDFRPRAEEADRTSSTRLLQLAEVDVLHSAKNGIWYQVSETPIGGRRVTRVVSQAARGALEHASAAPLSSTLCALRAQAMYRRCARPSPVEKDASGTLFAMHELHFIRPSSRAGGCWSLAAWPRGVAGGSQRVS